ncbi:hypothetical protein EXN65_05770 [Clostridium botulinum]|uniref:hypothetical protein n=1 Tax=Clostridium botulinum TaxID=1491 RepID=UPI00016BB2E1|nr:hypothetical protein [Clostridium botulinum]EDT84472.1 conserved hypothetical protein [Clostridium botulinum Bf]MBY6881707.1 hypothetical protein [Clostridium botulinum]NEZ88085.1 hypothetical protein [Clostridium botulinum]NFB01180.1 hypothetical protein [Clostridium botulinum]NFE30009.1 hypothetical protein [Clostridium botulinum]
MIYKKIRYDKHIESDKSITVFLKDFGIIVNKPTEEDAVAAAIIELREYVHDFLSDFKFWSEDKERTKQIQNLLEQDIICDWDAISDIFQEAIKRKDLNKEDTQNIMTKIKIDVRKIK